MEQRTDRNSNTGQASGNNHQKHTATGHIRAVKDTKTPDPTNQTSQSTRKTDPSKYSFEDEEE